MSIGQKLKKIRKCKKKNQKDFAKILELSERTYWSYEKSTHEISIVCLKGLYAKFAVNLNWLLDDNNNNDSQMFLDGNGIPTSPDMEKLIEDKIKQVLGELGVSSNLLQFAPRSDKQ